MITFLFVHGTGVREEKYRTYLEQIQKELENPELGIKVEGCFWGQTEGVNSDEALKTIPSPKNKKELPSNGTAKEEALLWEYLSRNPLYELEQLANPVEGKWKNLINRKKAAVALDRAFHRQKISPELSTLLQKYGFDEVFEKACSQVRESPEYAASLKTSQQVESVDDFRKIYARAIFAQSQQLAGALKPAKALPDDPELRENLLEEICLMLAPASTVFSTRIFEKVMPQNGYPEININTRYLQNIHKSVMEEASLVAGDILLYQVRGDGMRNMILKRLNELEGPVVLLGHSLGGIICVDLLVKEKLPQVKLLVTVGSQAPYFYSINSLYSLPRSEPLPDHFPPWTNIYDMGDLLSYIGENVFPGRIEDCEVNSLAPFPRTHKAYWKNKETYTVILNALKKCQLLPQDQLPT